MSTPRPADPAPARPRELWSRIVTARHRLLMLDYDGTLAPLTVRRHEAYPAAGVRECLMRIAEDRGTTVALVSGRPLGEIEALLGTLPVVQVAEHGWEIRWPDGRRLVHPLPRAAARALAEAAAAAESTLRAGIVERKRTAVVLHTRALDADAARVAEIAGLALWGGFCEQHGLRLDRIDGGLELRARGHDKGDTVRRLLASTPPGTLPIFIGDDPTDEDGFRAVIGRGLAIRVGPAERPSVARLRLDTPDDVVDFLEEWVTVATRPRRPEQVTP